MVQEVHDRVSLGAAHPARVQAVLRPARSGPRGQRLHRADVPHLRHEQGETLRLIYSCATQEVFIFFEGSLKDF